MCSNAQYPGDNGLTAAGQTWQTRIIFYCPQGATSLRLVFTGGYATGGPPSERQLSDPQPMTLSVETEVPPVWNAATFYAIGDRVSGPAAANNGSAAYMAVAPNVGSLPTAANLANWRQAIPAAMPIPITCNGQRSCVLGTSVDASGKRVTNAFLVTDPLPVHIAPGSLIAVRSWVHQTGSQVMARGPAQANWGGSYAVGGASLPDLTLGGTRLADGVTYKTGLLAILGSQNVARSAPSVCVIGDSRASGFAGNGVTQVSVLNGGSGYSFRDIGRLVTNVDSGGSPSNPMQSAIYVIQNVDDGRVARLGIQDSGRYAKAVSGSTAGVASSTPSGTQPTRPTYGTDGAGLKVSIPSGASGMTYGAGVYQDPRTFALGFMQKGLSDGGIPFVAFSAPGDMVATWAAAGGDTSRLAAIRLVGCTSVLINLGINDASNGLSGTAIARALTKLARQILALGTVKAVYLATLLPVTESTDYWATPARQTASTSNPARKAVNDWERKSPPPFAGVFDTTAPVEVNRMNIPTLDGGFWITNGSAHFATPDGGHLSTATSILAAKAISDRVGILQ